MKIKAIATPMIALAMCGCIREEEPRQTKDGPIWFAGAGGTVRRINDPENGVVCYVSSNGGISCLKESAK